MFERGKIVLVPFPFTDLTAQKVRPALIISRRRLNTRDVVVIFISSVMPTRKTRADHVVTEKDSDFDQTGLKKTSVFRCDKIATLDKKIVLGEIGSLPPKHLRQIDLGLRHVLGLK